MISAKDIFEFSSMEKYCYVRESNRGYLVGSKKEKHMMFLAAEEVSKI